MSRKRRTDLPSRGEVKEKVEKSKQDMQEKAEELDIIASDTEVTRETFDNLDFEGTADGTEIIQEAIQEAEDVTVDIFDEEDENLEQIQTDTEEYEDQLQGRSDTSQSDLGKVTDAAERIATEETKDELGKAKEEIHEEIEFIDSHQESAREARQENEQIQKQHQNRVHTEGR